MRWVYRATVGRATNYTGSWALANDLVRHMVHSVYGNRVYDLVLSSNEQGRWIFTLHTELRREAKKNDTNGTYVKSYPAFASIVAVPLFWNREDLQYIGNYADVGQLVDYTKQAEVRVRR